MRRKQFNADKATFLIITIPALALYTFFYIYSVIMGFLYSTTNWDGLARSYDFIGLANYVKVLGNKRFFESTGITIRYALIMVAGTVVLGVILAVAINSIKRFKTFFKSVYFFPATSRPPMALTWSAARSSPIWRFLPNLAPPPLRGPLYPMTISSAARRGCPKPIMQKHANKTIPIRITVFFIVPSLK